MFHTGMKNTKQQAQKLKKKVNRLAIQVHLDGEVVDYVK